MKKIAKNISKPILYIVLSCLFSFALAGGAFLDMEKESGIYIFDILVKIIILVGIFCYSVICKKNINSQNSKYFSVWLLAAFIPFIFNFFVAFCVPNRSLKVIEIINLLLTVFTTAAWEEMFFRYVGKTFFEKNGKYTWGTVALLALTFGFSHLINIFFYNPLSVLLQVLAASVSGVFLLALYRHTGNIWLVITAHFFQNIIAGFFQSFESAPVFENSYILVYVLMAVQLFIGIFILVKNKYICKMNYYTEDTQPTK